MEISMTQKQTENELDVFPSPRVCTRIVCALHDPRKKCFLWVKKRGLAEKYRFPLGFVEGSETHHEALHRMVYKQTGIAFPLAKIKCGLGGWFAHTESTHDQLVVYSAETAKQEAKTEEDDTLLWVSYDDIRAEFVRMKKKTYVSSLFVHNYIVWAVRVMEGHGFSVWTHVAGTRKKEVF